MGHDHEPYKIPDFRIYKVKDIPLLEKTQEALAAKGLRDPWLRNEVWRYNPEVFGTVRSRSKILFLRGLPIGFAAFVITVIGTELYTRLYSKKKGDHDHH